MQLRLLGASVLFLVLLLGPDNGLAQSLRNYRNRNGVRLSGDSGPRGRLEVASLDAWYTTTPGKISWSPVCDSPSFTDNEALIMCRMLNYTYGRKYYSPLIAYRKNETGVRYVGSVICEPRTFSPPPPVRSPPPPRSSLPPPPPSIPPPPPPVPPTYSGASTPSSVGGHRRLLRRSAGPHVRARELYSPLVGTLAAPVRSSPYSCMLRPGACESKGPFVGLECSHTPFEVTNPPPPSPPSPPPSPPAVSNSIRFYGPYLNDYTRPYGAVEPNLVDVDNMLGDLYGRFEVRVDVDGSSVWAPLCGLSNAGQFPSIMLAHIACGQLYDWPQPFDGGIGIVLPMASTISFNIPDAAVNPGDFDPDNVPAWAAVKGAISFDALTVQELELEITAEPCEAGTLFAAYCIAYGERRRS